MSMRTAHLRSMPTTTGRAKSSLGAKSSLPANHDRTQTELERLTRERDRLTRVRSNWIGYQRRAEAELATVSERLARLRERLGLQPPAPRPPARKSASAAHSSASRPVRQVDIEY